MTDGPPEAVSDSKPPFAESQTQATGEVEVAQDISEGMPEVSLRPRTESAASSLRQQPVSSSGGGKGKLSVGKSSKVERSKSSRRTGKKDKTSRRHKRETIDDNQSEISYQPDTDLSKSKASKKVVAGKSI